MKAIITIVYNKEIEIDERKANALIDRWNAQQYQDPKTEALCQEVVAEVEKAAGLPFWIEKNNRYGRQITCCIRASDGEVILEA